jgi:hypothetical protein
VEIDSAHVPQMEQPKQTHRAILDFLRDGRSTASGRRSAAS